ncbi:MAG TPA: alpha/beta hydrolase [Burkholderiaceae bacterium]|nr:alpha/beta hydrolase [Burkholderiaceae bacterium]
MIGARTVAAWSMAWLACASAAHADQLITLPTRSAATVSYWYMPRADASATLVLLPGGAGGMGLRDGRPQSGNFLVRSRDLFAAEHFNVAIVGRPSDVADMDTAFRISAAHIEDLRRVIDDLHARTSVPLWLVGTSRGTVSAAAAAIAIGTPAIAGVVLTSSITAFKLPGAVPTQRLSDVRVPVLVLHHEKDACPSCAPHDVPWIMKGLTQAPVKKLLWASGGDGARGDPCEAFHWHGYVGMEAQAVQWISAWVRDPTP